MTLASRHVGYWTTGRREDAGRAHIGDIYPCISVIHLPYQTSMHRQVLALVVRSCVGQNHTKRLSSIVPSRSESIAEVEALKARLRNQSRPALIISVLSHVHLSLFPVMTPALSIMRGSLRSHLLRPNRLPLVGGTASAKPLSVSRARPSFRGQADVRCKGEATMTIRTMQQSRITWATSVWVSNSD